MPAITSNGFVAPQTSRPGVSKAASQDFESPSEASYQPRLVSEHSEIQPAGAPTSVPATRVPTKAAAEAQYYTGHRDDPMSLLDLAIAGKGSDTATTAMAERYHINGQQDTSMRQKQQTSPALHSPWNARCGVRCHCCIFR